MSNKNSGQANKSTLLPTPEQGEILKICNENLKISAFAGTGKTSTLVMVANQLDQSGKKGLYLAFNKSIVASSKQRFPKSVNCCTFHSLAWRSLPKEITKKTQNPRYTPDFLVAKFSLTERHFPIDQNKRLSKKNQKTMCVSTYQQAILIMKALKFFCKTNETHPDRHHLNINLPITKAAKEEIESSLVPFLRQLWYMSVSTDSQYQGIHIDHDVYLKYWTLSNPVLDADYVLFDEAQDADPLMLNLLQKQTCQVIWVGDQYQQIYDWRGAKNAMRSIKVKEAFLTQSWRFGAKIANVANLFLWAIGSDRHVQGNPNVFDQIMDNTVIDYGVQSILCRSNLNAFIEAAQSSLSYPNRKIFLNINVAEFKSFFSAALRLKNRCAPDHPDLDQFESWSEVEYYAEHYSGDMKLLVNLINKQDANFLFGVLNNSVSLKDADVTISTTHKAKGLEWDVVKVTDGFFCGISDINKVITSATSNANTERCGEQLAFNIRLKAACAQHPNMPFKVEHEGRIYVVNDGMYFSADVSELRLLYVAMTRAKTKLILADSHHQNLAFLYENYKKIQQLTQANSYPLRIDV